MLDFSRYLVCLNQTLSTDCKFTISDNSQQLMDRWIFLDVCHNTKKEIVTAYVNFIFVFIALLIFYLTSFKAAQVNGI